MNDDYIPIIFTFIFLTGVVHDIFYFNYNYNFSEFIASLIPLPLAIFLVLRVLFYKFGTFFQRVLLSTSIILVLLHLIFYFYDCRFVACVPLFIAISLWFLPKELEDPDYPKIISKFYILGLFVAFVEIVTLLFLISEGISLFLILSLLLTIIFTITTLFD
jgi:hypothetical protein